MSSRSSLAGSLVEPHSARIERPLHFYLLPGGRTRWSPTARVQRGSSQTARCASTGDHLVCPHILPPSLLASLQGWGLIDLPLRASSECWFIWSISSIWFVWLITLEIHPEEPDRPERPANQTDKPERVARAQKIIRLHPFLCSESTGPTWVSFLSFSFFARTGAFKNCCPNVSCAHCSLSD
jgi:hypothetical protein